jgi:Acetoacetate decarboxylase (ADC)
MLSGFTPPYTPSGCSSLVPAPPWHYAGQVMSLAFQVDREAGQSFLPDGFGAATGNAACHFFEWQWTTDGSELLDPIYAQYKEFFVLVEADRGDARAFYCPFIYVDQDLSMVRGWLQGLPKKVGSVWMTRSYDLDHPAAAPVRAGTRFGASLCVKDRRLAEALITLVGEAASGGAASGGAASGAAVEPIGFLALPTFGLVGSPTLIGGPNAGEKTLVRAAVERTTRGPAYGAIGALQFFASPRDELSMLQPRSVTAASLSTVALTVVGAITA